MKKYCIATTEETRGKVLDAVKAVGFNKLSPATSDIHGIVFICLNGSSGNLGITHFHDAQYLSGSGFELLEASYVIAHAAELDGAKKPCEIAPKGYKFATNDELGNNAYPKCDVMYCSKVHGVWRKSTEASGWEDPPLYVFAIPEDHVFESANDKKRKELQEKLEGAENTLRLVREEMSNLK